VSLGCEVFNGTLSGSWDLVSGNVYNVTIDGDTEQVTITVFNNNNSLDFSFSITQAEDGDSTTQTVTFKGNRV